MWYKYWNYILFFHNYLPLFYLYSFIFGNVFKSFFCSMHMCIFFAFSFSSCKNFTITTYLGLKSFVMIRPFFFR